MKVHVVNTFRQQNTPAAIAANWRRLWKRHVRNHAARISFGEYLERNTESTEVFQLSDLSEYTKQRLKEILE